MIVRVSRHILQAVISVIDNTEKMAPSLENGESYQPCSVNSLVWRWLKAFLMKRYDCHLSSSNYEDGRKYAILRRLCHKITGLGGVVMMPVLGNLSDVYGRKKLLLIPLAVSIIPLGNATYLFYLYLNLWKICLCQICGYRDPSMPDHHKFLLCLLHHQYFNSHDLRCWFYLPRPLIFLTQADIVREEERVSAFGILFGVMYARSLCGTLAARFPAISQIFHLYMQ